MFELIFLVFIILYTQTIIFTIGIGKKYEKLPHEKLPSVSVIVAARNEEENILECLKSLDNLIYTSEKLEIIIVDDHSTDRTGEIIRKFIEDKKKFKLIIPQKQIGEVKGKANAIANALEIATGEVILTTDADCEVSPRWAETLASYYKEDVALVCGYTTQEGSTAFEGMQAVDFIYLLAVAAGAMNLGKPLSCIGNNMSYKRKVYDEIGGYAKIPFSVTEDFKLLMAFHKLKKYKIIYPLDKGGLVTSKPCSDFKSLYHQKKRWGVGGIDSDIIGYLVMATGFLTHTAMLAVPFFFSLPALYILLFKIIIDYLFLYPVYKRLELLYKFKHFISFQIYFIAYVFALPFILLGSRQVEWKGRKF